ncbi:MAG: haloacid dehalogenase-like hydrolase [Moorea sp. SIO2B7]|nr:haloacid dehalogenase-like hydrolase [Moorena sp. SIO2B7]
MESAPNDTPIIVDFDETLFLRNSTEEYLNSLQPRAIGAILLALLSFVKPWNWLPRPIKGDVSRDWVRVVVATLFFPWTLILWQWRAKQLANSYPNTTLIQALTKNSNSQVILATQGFDFIVSPIAKHLPLALSEVIACRFWQGAIDRKNGKDLLLTKALGEDKVARSMVITDSTDDTPLLSLVSIPCLVIWPEAEYVAAMTDAYVPFFYIERVKQRGQKYFIRVILAEDLLFLILGLSWLSNKPILHAISMTFLVLSFWCIYEFGYIENDLIAERFEKSPKLSESYKNYKRKISVWQPWIWAIILAFPGIIFIELSKSSATIVMFNSEVIWPNLVTSLTDGGLWLCLLLLLRVSFWGYNHVDKQTRIWLYPILQIYKCFGFLFVTVGNVIATMFFSAQVLSRWIPYIIYRYAKADFSEIGPVWAIGHILCFLIFLFLLFAYALGTQNFSTLLSWQTLVIVIFFLARVYRRLWRIVRQAHPISQDQWSIKTKNS